MPRPPLSPALLAFLFVASVAAGAGAVDLPSTAPIPDSAEVPPPASASPPAPPTTAPLPEAKPAVPAAGKPAGEPAAPAGEAPASEALPSSPPLPQQAPDRPPEPEKPGPPPPPPDPRSALRPDASGVLPADETACRAALTALGAEFAERKAEIDEAAGCAIPYPITLKSLGRDIGLKPDAVMNCTMALAAARFARDVVGPAAKSAYGQDLASVDHASAYVCRPRNGTNKLSEHAFGNALDIARFTLRDGTAVDVKPDPDEKAAALLSAIRKAACGPFKTVLGPGSDPDHEFHFHLDLQPRRNGGTFCQ